MNDLTHIPLARSIDMIPTPLARHRLLPVRGIAAVAAAATLAAILAGCATTQESHPALERSHASFRTRESDTKAAEQAPTEMAQAREALKAADAASARRDKPEAVDRLACLAEQRVSIAREALSAKTWDAETEPVKAAALGDKAARDVAAAQKGLKAELAVVSAGARDEKARAAALEQQLKAINAKPTPLGDVITLGDVLFDTNRADLRPAGMRGMDKLVDFFKLNPKRKARIEGFTDNRAATRPTSICPVAAPRPCATPWSRMGCRPIA
jgi:outer membrane protein OmpA-like peptidoglycan-associated protein